MPAHVRPMVAAGIAAISATAIVAAPAIGAVPDELVTREVRLTASQTVTPEFRELVAAAQQQLTAQNAATDFVDDVYEVITYWTDYGVELADYALQFVPFGSLISSQINIIYPQIIGVTDSVVYDLIDPVLENPLDPAAYLDGLVDVAVSAVTALVNVVVGEIDYFLGWLIPPLPGPFPFPTLSVNEEITEDEGLQIQVFQDEVSQDEVLQDEVSLEKTVNVELEAPLEEPDEALDEVLTPSDAEPVESESDDLPLDSEVESSDLEDIEEELSDGAEATPPEQPGGGTDSDGGVDQDAVGHDVTPTEDDVASRPTEGERDQGGEPGPQGQSGEAA